MSLMFNRPTAYNSYYGKYGSSAGSNMYYGGYYRSPGSVRTYYSWPIAYDYRAPSLKSLHRSLYGREYGSLSNYGYPTNHGFRSGPPEVLPRKYDITTAYSRNYCPRYSKHRWVL